LHTVLRFPAKAEMRKAAVAAFQVITRYIREQLEKPPTAPSAVITDLSPAQEKHSPANE
jgi:hypothetical protein